MTHETGGIERHWQRQCQDKRDLILGGGPFRARSKRQVIARLASGGLRPLADVPRPSRGTSRTCGLSLEGYLRV